MIPRAEPLASRQAPGAPLPRLLRNLLFSLAVFAGTLGSLEIGLRLLGIPDPGLYDGDPGYLWTLRPDLDREVPFPERGGRFRVRTSHAGFRGPEPEPGATWCLGDSTTFGWGVSEEEAWPARLATLLGRPVQNGGVPGYSTAQGLATLDRVLAFSPSTVILGYLVRDADLAPMTDAARRPGPDLQILRALSALRPPPQPPVQGVFRVPPADYAANLAALAARVRAAGARPILLAFPMQRPPEAHLAALQGLCAAERCLTPHLEASAFFPEDPIHLTPAGHASLAEQVAEAL